MNADPDSGSLPPPQSTPELPQDPGGGAWWGAAWKRIREHKVVEWSLAYAAAAYTLLHVVEMVGDAFDWPHLVMRLLVVILVMGAPIVVTLAWYHGHRASHRVSGPELAIITVLLIIAAGIVSVVTRPGRDGAAHAAAESRTGHPAGGAANEPASGAPAELSIAVLPFADMSATQDQGYFADGMAEELTDVLVRIPRFRVIGRVSAFQFKGRNEDLRTIGGKLGATYVVEGSVRKAADRIRITAQLIDTRSGTHLWSEQYDRELGDVLQLQDQIAASIARTLQVMVAPSDARASRQLRSVEAYTFYLRGRAALDRGDDSGLREAARDLEQALAIDADFPGAAELLSVANLDMVGNTGVDTRMAWEAAASAAGKALRLDPQSAVAHAVLGIKCTTFDYDWAAARNEFDRTVAANSRDPVALYLASWLAFNLGRHEEALRLQNYSLAIDPLNPDAIQNGAVIHYLMGSLADAERGFRASMEVSPSFVGNHWYLGQIELLQGMPEAALREMQAEPLPALRLLGSALALHALGRNAESDAALARVTSEYSASNATNIAIVYAYRGERDKALRWLAQAVAQRDITLGHKFRDEPKLAPLRSDPRFKELARRMNLPG